MKVLNSASVAVVYDDPVTGAKRTIVAGEQTWIQPSANVPPGYLNVLDAKDGYGKLTRRVFVTAADVAAAPTRYNGGCIGQPLYIDEFNGVGDTESLSNRLFKRTRFEYADPSNPTKWTTITETEQRED
jgi:hypothetical protein